MKPKYKNYLEDDEEIIPEEGDSIEELDFDKVKKDDAYEEEQEELDDN